MDLIVELGLRTMARRKRKNVASGNGWPFDQPPNCAVITLRQIIEDNEPILHVSHNSDDHGWQFLGLEDPRTKDGVVVCFEHILERDPSIRELADLPPGWHAWRRSAHKPWTREPNPYDEA